MNDITLAIFKVIVILVVIYLLLQISAVLEKLWEAGKIWLNKKRKSTKEKTGAK